MGALVGAVSAGLIQIINNWASGKAWHEGVVQAMVIGAVGGALGGGLGFAGGALASGAAAAGGSVLRQVAFTVGADLLSEGLTQTFAYVAYGQDFNWQGFVMAGAMSGASFRAHPSGPRGAGARADVPSPAAAASAGGRRAAVTQVAGGAALGLGIEYATATISGQEFDLTKAASAAASGAVGARMARRGGGAPAAEPTTGLGRAAQRVRGFDPGGIGARLETRLQGLGARFSGARPEVAGTATTMPRIEEPGARVATEPEAISPRVPETPETTTRPQASETEAGLRPRPSDETTGGRGTRPADETAEAQRARARAEPATPHSHQPEVEPGVVSRRKTLDGRDDIKVNRDGTVDICTDCAKVRSRYATEINADPALKQRMDDIEALADPDIKAARCAELQDELSRLREASLRPPTDASGAVDFRRLGRSHQGGSRRRGRR